MKILKKIIIAIVALALLVGLGLGGLLYYEESQRAQKLQAYLDYKTDRTWQWHQEYLSVQSLYDAIPQQTFLRKVSISKNSVVQVYLKDDGQLAASVYFYVECEPDTEITTSLKYSNGEAKVLHCGAAGEYLSLGVSWEGPPNDIHWTDDFDGFKVDVNFKHWNFVPLQQEVTLRKAK